MSNRCQCGTCSLCKLRARVVEAEFNAENYKRLLGIAQAPDWATTSKLMAERFAWLKEVGRA